MSQKPAYKAYPQDDKKDKLGAEAKSKNHKKNKASVQTRKSVTELPDSVGQVKEQKLHVAAEFHCISGGRLPGFNLVYETYGTLNPAKDNAILICHALSSSHHAAGYHHVADRKPGWWEHAIGPNKPIDTRKFFVVCSNNLGGCHGSTGPVSINPETGKMYGPEFPMVMVKDWVRSQKYLMEHLHIKQWVAVIGGSLGGMQALQWAIDFPDKLRNAVIIASTPKLSAQNIGFNEIARQAILTDPHFHQGRYYEHQVIPRQGLKIARMLGHITYLSDELMREKFGRTLKNSKPEFRFDVEFQVESYLHYQSTAFSDTFDANTYLLMTKALDYFDPAADYQNNLEAALKNCLCRFLVIAFASDWRFSPARSQEIVDALIRNGKTVSYANIDAHQGHDAFLLPDQRYFNLLRAYLERL